jgi:hypothetical protein
MDMHTLLGFIAEQFAFSVKSILTIFAKVLEGENNLFNN